MPIEHYLTKTNPLVTQKVLYLIESKT